MELRGHSPHFHIHVSVSDLYIPTIDLPNLLQEICGTILGIYKSLTTHECGDEVNFNSGKKRRLYLFFLYTDVDTDVQM